MHKVFEQYNDYPWGVSRMELDVIGAIQDWGYLRAEELIGLRILWQIGWMLEPLLDNHDKALSST